jgi:isopentenyl-diphosphate Delta-isomerase
VNSQQVILVDENDNAIGSMEKMDVHLKGLMHRAFSIFIFNSRGEMLLQQRAAKKYHSAGLWSNACCSHPHPGEEIKPAAERRLYEEMGFKTSLQKVFDFKYEARFENGLTENEFDHVFVGEYEGEIKINPDEVNDHSFKSMRKIKQELQKNPRNYTAWFHIAFPKIEEWWDKYYGEL